MGMDLDPVMAHATVLATLMAMAFRINCACATAVVLVCNMAIVLDPAMVCVTELVTLMAMAFLINCAFVMVAVPVCNTVPVQCRVDEVRVWVKAWARALEPLKVRVLGLAAVKVWVRVWGCVTVPALTTKQSF